MLGASEDPGRNEKLLSELTAAYADRNATAIEITLDSVILEITSCSVKQEAFGTSSCIEVIFSFLREIMYHPYVEPVIDAQIGSVFSVFPSDETTQIKQRELIAKCYWFLVRLCRRDMSKATANTSNIELIANYRKSLEIITELSKMHIKHPDIILPTMWLIMILASDSSERQFRLAAANTTVLIVKVMVQHAGDTSIAEMACRAARNIAAGDADIVAKFVEDKVCEGIVGILRVQLGQPPFCKELEGTDVTVEGIKELEGTDVVAEGIKESAVIDKDQQTSEATESKSLSGSAAVSEAALWAIVNLACEDNVSTILGAVGGIDAVVDAMHTFRTAGVALAGTSAIRNMSSVGTHNYALLAKTTVCEVLVSLLVEHSADIELLETGLWAITNLSCDCVLSDRLGSLGVPKIMLDFYYSVVPLHPQEGRPAGPISEVCLWAVINLAASGLLNEDRLGSAGCCELVQRVMCIYRQREGMMELSLNALIHLIYHSESNKARMGKQSEQMSHITQEGFNGEDIFSTVFEVIKLYIDNDTLAENVIKFFLLCINGSESSTLNKSKLMEHDVLSVAADIMSTHQLNQEITRLGCGLLLVMRYDDDVYKNSLKEKGQLDAAGKASPKGMFLEISEAWEFKVSVPPKSDLVACAP